MRAGDLDRVVMLQRASGDVNEYGEPVETWIPLATVRAKLTTETGREFFSSGQTFSAGRGLLLIRWRADVLVTDRAVLDGVVWNIESVREVGRRVALELMVTRTA